MEIIEQLNSRFSKKKLVAASIIVPGLCWYFSNGLNGNFWYLLWLAPVPVLLISFRVTARKTFFISFAGYLIGRLSWFHYLVIVAGLIPAMIFTLALPLIFAVIVMVSRSVVISIDKWYGIFAFPVFYTAFELLLIKFSPDGTAASIAYSQLDFVPLIQIASVTGILGITFMVTFIPAALVVGWHYRREKNKLMPLAIISIVLVTSVFVFGIIRITKVTKQPATTVGLVVLDESLHKMGRDIDFQYELQHIKNYAQEITALAARGAKLVVLPERAINVNGETAAAAISILSSTAKQNHVAIVTGYTNFKNVKERNSALVINAEGDVAEDYNKVHLVNGLEGQFTPGTEIGLFKFKEEQAGVAICKDLDFPDYIKRYGTNKTTFVCIPAWDFVVDDWLHSRMAVLRGVENGFSEVRTARLGRLSISDFYGRVTAEANSSNGKSASMIGEVVSGNKNTLYTRFGDWFGIVITVAAVFLVLISISKRGKLMIAN
jgi:apolipoprotein N-acyltransferase